MRLEQLDQDNGKLRSELAYSQEQISYTSARAESLAAMLTNQEAIQASESTNPRLAQLEAENRQLKEALTTGTVSDIDGSTASTYGNIRIPCSNPRKSEYDDIDRTGSPPANVIDCGIYRFAAWVN